MVTDVVERINELAAEEKCPHCERSWHERALTQKVAAMFDRGSLDPNYFAYEDTSRVLCDGSRFIGPLRPEPTEFAAGGAVTVTGTSWSGTWTFVGLMPGTTYTFHSSSSAYTLSALNNLKAGWGGSTYSYMLGADQSSPWIFPQWQMNPPEPVCTEPPPDVTVEFGPQNWHYEFQRAPNKKYVLATHWSWSPTPTLAKRVCDLWAKFKAVPAPATRGYDFKPISEKFNQQFNYFNKEKKCSR